MGRKTTEVHITDEGRDKDKVYVLTEMSASQAERWAMRAFLALARGGVDIPENIADAGMAGVAMVGLKALGGMSDADALALMDEMFTCVQIKPDPVGAPGLVRKLVENDIEEIATRVRLRMEVFTLHTGFSMAGVLSRLSPATNPPASPSAPTFPAQ